jgi:hypothetical protein
MRLLMVRDRRDPSMSRFGECPCVQRNTGRGWTWVPPLPKPGGQGVAGSNPVSPTV